MMRETVAAASSRQILEEGIRILTNAGIDTGRLDAEILLAHACGVSRAAMLTGSATVSGDAAEKFRAMIERRAAREPIAYVIGHKEFFSLDFEVTPAVLIPRPETETLVEAALNFLATRPQLCVLDLGTGSGAIAIAIAMNAQTARVMATDISKGALEVARRNARHHACNGRIEFREADLFASDNSEYDLILSNPPYVAQQELNGLAPEVRRYEPREALTDGGDGLIFHRRIAKQSHSRLAIGGAVMVEIGAGQRMAVEGLFRSAGFSNIDAVTDLAGIERVIRAQGS